MRPGARTLALLLLAACTRAPEMLRTHQTLEQPTGSVLRTVVGGIVFRLRQATERPDASGRPNPKARPVDRGGLEVRYQGFGEDGQLAFSVKQVDVEWNDPELSALPPVDSDASVNLDDPAGLRFGPVVVEVIEATPEGLRYRLRRRE